MLSSFLLLASTPKARPATHETLRSFSVRVTNSLIRKDWATFRQFAAKAFTIEEYVTAYQSFFVKGFKDSWQGNLGFHHFAALSNSTVIENSPNLPSQHRTLFLNYCREVIDSHDAYGGRVYPWDKTLSDGFVSFECGSAFGPCTYGTVASNMHFAIEFQRLGSRYLVKRLLTFGH